MVLPLKIKMLIMSIINFSEFNLNEELTKIKAGDKVVVTKEDTSDEPERSLKVGTEYIVKTLDYLSGWLHLEGEKYLHNPDNFKKVKPDKKINENSATTGVVGSGGAVGGGATGNFTSAAGISVSGGDSGTAFSTNSVNGMGAIKSSQPSSIPGQVWGGDGVDGSGDIGSVLGTYTKQPAGGVDKKRKKKGEEVENKIKNMYIVKFSEFDGVKNVKENAYIPPKKIKCQECGEEVEDDFVSLLGHVQNKHWAQPTEKFIDCEPREMVQRFFHVVPEKK
jgi:hypothetical protein